MTPPPRTPQQRKRDALDRLQHEVDAWVHGRPRKRDTVSGAVVISVGRADLAGGYPVRQPDQPQYAGHREGSPRHRPDPGPGPDRGNCARTCRHRTHRRGGDAFAAKTGFDPRQLTSYLYFRIYPQRLGRHGARPTNSPAASSCAAGSGLSLTDGVNAGRHRLKVRLGGEGQLFGRPGLAVRIVPTQRE